MTSYSSLKLSHANFWSDNFEDLFALVNLICYVYLFLNLKDTNETPNATTS